MITAGRRYLGLWVATALVGVAPAARGQDPAATPLLEAALTGGPAADRSGAFAGAGLYFIRPYFQNNPAYTLFVQQTNDTTLDPTKPDTRTIAESASRVEVRHRMATAPLVWFGYLTDDGIGVRVRGWGFQEGTSQSVTLPPFAGAYRVGGNAGETVIVASGTLLTASSATPLGLQAFGDTLSIKYGPETATLAVTTKLLVNVGDAEAVLLTGGPAGDVTVSGGLRYARLDQSYNAYDAQSGGAVLRTLASGSDFSGVGPTLAVEGRRAVAGGFRVYGLGRGSVVFGAADQNAAFFGTELRNDDPNPQFASSRRDRAIPIFDLEAGLDYGHEVGGCWLSGRVGLVGQRWFNAGGASRSTSMNPATTLRPVLGGAPMDSDLSFLGLIVQVGLNY